MDPENNQLISTGVNLSQNEDFCFPKTDASNFLAEFTLMKTRMLSDLESVSRDPDGSTKESLSKFFDDSSNRIDQMQKWFNDSLSYLPCFDVERASRALKDLDTAFRTKRSELLPTKKFCFSKSPKTIANTTNKNATVVHPVELGKSVPDPATRFKPELFASEHRLILSNIQGPRHLVLPNDDFPAESLRCSTLHLSDLHSCRIEIQTISANLVVSRLNNCKLITRPVSGSVWVEDCRNCDFSVACRQLRVHQTECCRLSLHVASNPIMEKSTKLQFLPYQTIYDQFERDLVEANISVKSNLWSCVNDFDYPMQSSTDSSPNWSVLPEHEWKSFLSSEPNNFS